MLNIEKTPTKIKLYLKFEAWVCTEKSFVHRLHEFTRIINSKYVKYNCINLPEIQLLFTGSKNT